MRPLAISRWRGTAWQFYEQFDEMMGRRVGKTNTSAFSSKWLPLSSTRPNVLSSCRGTRSSTPDGCGSLSCSRPKQVPDQVSAHLGLDDITGAIYGRRDGYLNPRGALQGFAVERARELGCTLVGCSMKWSVSPPAAGRM